MFPSNHNKHETVKITLYNALTKVFVFVLKLLMPRLKVLGVRGRCHIDSHFMKVLKIFFLLALSFLPYEANFSENSSFTSCFLNIMMFIPQFCDYFEEKCTYISHIYIYFP